MITSGAEAFLQALDRKARILAPAARANCAANAELCNWLLEPLARWAREAYGDAVFDDAAAGYAQYCFGVARLQRIYESKGAYRPEAIPEIVSGVYENEGEMLPYMWAAILIYAFWPSMIGQLRMFRHEFVRKLPRGARVLEVASGHGVLSLLAAEERDDVEIEGLDISPPAVAVASRLLQVSSHADRVRFSVQDALNLNTAHDNCRYEGIISAMLAEHLQNPSSLLFAISHRLTPTGLVYFSTALESPQRDHVYEFNRESQPLLMAEEAGLRATRLVSDASPAVAGSRFLPRATAMILESRHAGSSQKNVG